MMVTMSKADIVLAHAQTTVCCMLFSAAGRML
jgi:hypothetical protein